MPKLKKYVPASELIQGNHLQLSDGTCTSVTSLRWVDTLVTVYNISVADNHNYFAGGVLTHNNGGCLDEETAKLIYAVTTRVIDHFLKKETVPLKTWNGSFDKSTLTYNQEVERLQTKSDEKLLKECDCLKANTIVSETCALKVFKAFILSYSFEKFTPSQKKKIISFKKVKKQFISIKDKLIAEGNNNLKLFLYKLWLMEFNYDDIVASCKKLKYKSFLSKIPYSVKTENSSYSDRLTPSSKAHLIALPISEKKILFRGDSRNPKQIFDAGGFRSRGRNEDLETYAIIMPRDAAFIGTSKNHPLCDKELTARKFATSNIGGYSYEGFIYFIKNNGKGVDVNESFIKKYGEKGPPNRTNSKGQTVKWLPNQREIAFKFHIPLSQIYGAMYIDVVSNIIGNFIPVDDFSKFNLKLYEVRMGVKNGRIQNENQWQNFVKGNPRK